MLNSSIWPRDRNLSGALILSQSGPVSDGIEGVLRIPQSSSFAEALQDCLVSYLGQTLGWGVLPLCRDGIGVFYGPSRLDHFQKSNTK